MPEFSWILGVDWVKKSLFLTEKDQFLTTRYIFGWFYIL